MTAADDRLDALLAHAEAAQASFSLHPDGRKAWDDFIAACDPDTIRALVQRVKDTEAKAKELRAMKLAEMETRAVVELRDLWNAARDDRDDAIRLMSELMQRTPSVGEDRDGFIAGYVLPTGPLHRIAAYLTQHGQSFTQTKHYADEKFANTADRDRLLTALTALADTADQQATDDLGNLNDSDRVVPLGLVPTRKIRDLIHDHGGDHE